ncbi:MobA/MobL family protein [Zooshikella ganghwensis]|nr:MobA/MobL family protein [Zooshikella ganghwensis]
MAIYHCHVKVISRSSGRSSTGAAAYRAAESIQDKRTGIVHDYTRKKGVSYSQILAPTHAPHWAYDRAQLWNEVEHIEKRKDAQLCREVEVALPRELNEKQMRQLIRDYAQVRPTLSATFSHYQSSGSVFTSQHLNPFIRHISPILLTSLNTLCSKTGDVPFAFPLSSNTYCIPSSSGGAII